MQQQQQQQQQKEVRQGMGRQQQRAAMVVMVKLVVVAGTALRGLAATSSLPGSEPAQRALTAMMVVLLVRLQVKLVLWPLLSLVEKRHSLEMLQQQEQQERQKATEATLLQRVHLLLQALTPLPPQKRAISAHAPPPTRGRAPPQPHQQQRQQRQGLQQQVVRVVWMLQELTPDCLRWHPRLVSTSMRPHLLLLQLQPPATVLVVVAVAGPQRPAQLQVICLQTRMMQQQQWQRLQQPLL
mmetsp:Transcript_14829/g.39981  ORF Transcript_14829/g.39981 Transcript_14829/m.39981 type:complete len:240 (-) Transcript_14829:335-1054(-)